MTDLFDSDGDGRKAAGAFTEPADEMALTHPFVMLPGRSGAMPDPGMTGSNNDGTRMEGQYNPGPCCRPSAARFTFTGMLIAPWCRACQLVGKVMTGIRPIE